MTRKANPGPPIAPRRRPTASKPHNMTRNEAVDKPNDGLDSQARPNVSKIAKENDVDRETLENH